MSLISRIIFPRILNRLQPQKAIILFGARRVGKTILLNTIISQFGNDVLVLNGEDNDTLTLLENKSIANYRRLLQNVHLLVLDEAHNIPDIGKKLKLIVDEVPNIKVIASGSSSFDLHNQTGEPLVGRSTQFLLFPLSQAEISTQETLLDTKKNLETRLVYGSYPEVVTIDNLIQKEEYLKELVNSYLLKDILVIDGIKNSSKMLNLLRLVAYQVGSEVSYDELAKQLGLSKNTVEKYLDLLTKVFVLKKLGGYSKNLRKEIVKGSKWYFVDNGIRNGVIGNFNPIALRQDVGVLWENYNIIERMKFNNNEGITKNYYFWRTYDGQEIDLIEEDANSLMAFEYKWGDKKVKPPHAFVTNYPDASYNVLNQNNYLDFILHSI